MLTSGNIVVVRKGRSPAGYTPIYIGRPSVFGNPFFMKDESQRETVIAKFDDYFYAKMVEKGELYNETMSLVSRVQSGEKIALECFCAPKKCHGDVIRHLVQQLATIQDSDEHLFS